MLVCFFYRIERLYSTEVVKISCLRGRIQKFPDWAGNEIWAYLYYWVFFFRPSLCKGSSVSATAGSTPGTSFLVWRVCQSAIAPNFVQILETTPLYLWFHFRKPEEITRVKIGRLMEVGVHGHVFSCQKLLRRQSSVRWRIVVPNKHSLFRHNSGCVSRLAPSDVEIKLTLISINHAQIVWCDSSVWKKRENLWQWIFRSFEMLRFVY